MFYLNSAGSINLDSYKWYFIILLILHKLLKKNFSELPEVIHYLNQLVFENVLFIRFVSREVWVSSLPQSVVSCNILLCFKNVQAPLYSCIIQQNIIWNYSTILWTWQYKLYEIYIQRYWIGPPVQRFSHFFKHSYEKAQHVFTVTTH